MLISDLTDALTMNLPIVLSTPISLYFHYTCVILNNWIGVLDLKVNNYIVATFITSGSPMLQNRPFRITSKFNKTQKNAHSICCNGMRLRYICMCNHLGWLDWYILWLKAKTITLCPYGWKICIHSARYNAPDTLRTWSRTCIGYVKKSENV